MAIKAPTTQEAIRQTKPFRSPRHEAVIALALAADALARGFAQIAAAHEITAQQYNVLRILRGAGDAGLATLEIAERMVEHAPGITRLLDRLEAQGLVVRDRASGDRRKVIVRITERGLALLGRMDEPVAQFDERAMSCLGDREVAQLVALLNRIRVHQP